MKEGVHMSEKIAVKMFDDYYYVGDDHVGFHILKTDEGLVMFDSMTTEDADEVFLIPGLKELGLENEKILAIMLTHGHFDHYLGAEHVRLRTGCDVMLTAEDCIFMVNSLDNRDKGMAMPHITKLIKDGDVLTFGKHDIHVIGAAGHTPGCVNYSFPVHDNGAEHRTIMTGGGGIFGPGRYPGKEGYPDTAAFAARQALLFAESLMRTWEFVKEHNCDVYLAAHPFAAEMLEKYAQNKEGEPNHLIDGIDGVKAYLKKQYDRCLESAWFFCPIE